MLSIGLWRRYINITITIMDIIHHLALQSESESLYNWRSVSQYVLVSSPVWDFWPEFQTQLNSVGLSVPHREHITSPLWTQQVNAIYRFVNIIITILDIIHCPAFYLEHDISETGLCLRLQVDPTQLCSQDRGSLYLRIAVAGVHRQRLAPSNGPNWVGSTLIWGQNAVSESLFIK
jgi:hypothetical protein